MTKRRFIATSFISLMVFLCVTSAFFSHFRIFRRTDYALNTVITIQAAGKNVESAVSEAIRAIKDIDSALNAHSEQSEIYALNHTPFGKWAHVSEETFSLIEKSVEISKKTKGAFDITIKPIADLWNINSETPKIPEDYEIEEVLLKVGYENIELDKKNSKVRFKKAGMEIDLGAIAKGYAADKAAQILRENGIKSALLDLGGNVYAIGKKPGGGKWKIGIQEPFEPRGTYFAKKDLKDCSAVTSGAYERYFEENGKIYHHVLDPKTGRPCESDIKSATVLCPKSYLADALSTAAFVLGKDGAKEIAETFDNVSIIVYGEKVWEY